MSIKEEIKTKKVKVTKRYCDICSKTACKSDYRGSVCVICKRDVCCDHAYYEEIVGDCYDTYCTQCWEIGEGFRELMDKIEKSSDEKIENLRKIWEKKCLKNREEWEKKNQKIE